MVKRYNFSVPEEEHKRMKTLALEMGMSVSDIIRKCFFKLSMDDKMRAIIKRGEFTSHNVRSESEEKAEAGNSNGPDSSSLNPSKRIDHLDQLHNYWKTFCKIPKVGEWDQLFKWYWTELDIKYLKDLWKIEDEKDKKVVLETRRLHGMDIPDWMQL